MKYYPFIVALGACLLFVQSNSLRAAEDQAPAASPAAPSAISTELKDLMAKVQGKLRQGKRTAADLEPELEEFDALLAKHKDERTDEVAQVIFMKALLYLQVLEDPDKASKLIRQVKQDFPESGPGRNADRILDSIEKQAQASKIRSSLVVGAKFPDFEETDLSGKPLSLANYHGRVVLVDFWATWCGPCVKELPTVLEAYKKYHGKGFEIVGISLDQSEEKLKSFIEEKEMTWVQYFDGKGWGNKLAAKYGVNSIPATYLLDGAGRIIAKDLRGEALETAVAKALSL